MFDLAQKLNRDRRHARQVGQLATFVKQYARKAQRAAEPNNRSVESAVKRLPPTELGRLLHEDDY